MELWKLLLCLIFPAVVLSSSDLPGIFENIQRTNVTFHNIQAKYVTKLKELQKQLNGVYDSEEQVAVINEYVDELLTNLNQYISSNPIDLPGFEASFQWTIFSGWVTLEDGKLNGLSTFKRIGDVTVKYQYPNIKISMPLGFSNLGFSYYYEMKFMYLGPDGKATGKSSNNKFTLDLEMNMVNLRARLERFNLKTLGSVSLKFSGSILTDWIVNLAIAAVMPILKPILGMVIEGYVVDGMQYILTTYNTVVCTILADCAQQIATATVLT